MFLSTLKRTGAYTFHNCCRLRGVEIPNGVEHIGEWCFCGSGLEEITLPNTLKEISKNAFASCDNLKIVWVEEDGAPDVRKYIKNSVVILLVGTMVGNKLLKDLRR